eukprot:Colp12_sorted_trinity150504_noHs@410
MSNNKKSGVVHFVAGGLGGTVGAVLTCPLEVVKTRLQSHQYRIQNMTTMQLCRQMYRYEGFRSFWKGVLPNLVGAAPSRAIYFYTYTKCKEVYPKLVGQDTSSASTPIHIASAASAGIATATATNPIWMVKTRLQLDASVTAGSGLLESRSLNTVRTIYRTEGFGGFYRGLVASYFGIFETSIQFVVYEKLKAQLKQYRARHPLTSDPEKKHAREFLELTAVAAVSKLIASTSTYPHEVVRTRLREDPVNGAAPYRGFMNCLTRIAKEEGVRALYGGMGPHLLRVVPNAAIMFTVYELVVHLYGAL